MIRLMKNFCFGLIHLSGLPQCRPKVNLINPDNNPPDDFGGTHQQKSRTPKSLCDRMA
jgi:hypothetical protein